MKWLPNTDYHGSRLYGTEPPIGRFTLMMAWLTNIARTALLKLDARRGSSTVLLNHGVHNFSLLGADDRRAPSRAADCPFPTANTFRLRHED